MILFELFSELFYTGMYYVGSVMKNTGDRLQKWGNDIEEYYTESDEDQITMEELEPSQNTDDTDFFSNFPK